MPTVNPILYDALLRAARKGGTTTYADLAPLLDVDIDRKDDREWLAGLLRDISIHEHEQGRPMLSAVVVLKGRQTPGQGFFDLAKKLGRMTSEEPEAFWRMELRRVYQQWRASGAPEPKLPRRRTTSQGVAREMAFFLAVRSGDAEAVRELLALDPALAEARDEQGVSAVLMAVYRGQKAVLDVLLAVGPALDLFEAAAIGDAERLGHLLDTPEGQAQVNSFTSQGFTPLGLAAFFGHADAIGVLLDHGADMEMLMPNQKANTALDAAVAARKLDTARLLLERGANVNCVAAGGYTPLHKAVTHKDAPMVRLLLKHRASMDEETDEGKTAYDLALESKSKTVIKLLEEAAG
jgi:ankyrin repeat protein